MNSTARILALLLLTISLASFPAGAGHRDREFILRAPAEAVAALASSYGLEVVEAVAADHSQVVLVRVPDTAPPEVTASMVAAESGVESFEPVQLASLSESEEGFQVDQSSSPILETLARTGVAQDSGLNRFFSTALWNGYARQPALELLRVDRAHQVAGYGRGIVAIIDTGIDPDHPILRGALVEGYDFVLDRPGDASEWSSLDQSTSPILEEATAAIVEQSSSPILEGNGSLYVLNQSSSPILEQSSSPILEGIELPPAFGHGTMVAGIVRLVAPGARIMPLRVFDGQGRGSLFDIIRAIHFAVERGARVINMSFSTEEFSAELARAVNYAHRRGVVCVAAAGNRGARVVTYPAAFGNNVGVASIDHLGRLSPFSNHGTDVAALAAPGEAIVTTFPGGLYAAAWGTSFAAPFLSGTLALLPDLPGGPSSSRSSSEFYVDLTALSRGARFLPDLAAAVGMGALDVAATVSPANRSAR